MVVKQVVMQISKRSCEQTTGEFVNQISENEEKQNSGLTIASPLRLELRTYGLEGRRSIH